MQEQWQELHAGREDDRRSFLTCLKCITQGFQAARVRRERSGLKASVGLIWGTFAFGIALVDV